MGKPKSKESNYSFFETPGLPSPYFNYRLDIEGNIIHVDKSKPTKFYRPCIPINIDESDVIKTELYIHSTPLYQFDAEWMCIESGLMISRKFDIPVLILYPLSYKANLKNDLSEYEELYCCASAEEYVDKWLAFADKTVNNFYLNFLKDSPRKHITHKLDPLYIQKKYTSKDLGVTYCSPEKWEEISERSINKIDYIIQTLFATSDESEIRKVYKLWPLRENEIIFDKLEKILELAPEDKWKEWISTQKIDAFKVNPTLSKDSPRLNILKSYLCSFSILGNIPEETLQALLKYHKLM